MLTESTLAIVRGDTFIAELAFEISPGVPWDLTGASVEWSFAGVRGGQPSYQYTTEPVVTVTDAAAGLVRLRLEAAETREIPARSYAYELTVTSAGGERGPSGRSRMVVHEETVEGGEP